MTRRFRITVIGFLVGLGSLGTIGWLRSSELSQRFGKLQKETRIVAGQVVAGIGGDLELHRVALQQTANFFRNSEIVTEAEFYSFAKVTTDLTSLFHRVCIVDPSFHIRWIYPSEPYQSFVGYGVKKHLQGFDTVIEARRTREAVLSRPLPLLDGPTGFLLAVPIFKEEEFLGEVVGVFHAADFFDSVLLPDTLEGYDIKVMSDGLPLFRSDSFDEPGSPNPTVRQTFNINSGSWSVWVKPRKQVILSHFHSDRVVFWTIGGILSLLMGCVGSAITHIASTIAVRYRSQKSTLLETRDRLGECNLKLIQAEKISALGEMVAGVAHELNSPLATVLGYTQLLLSRNLDTHFQRRLEIISNECERMGKIVRNLLTFARKQPPEKKLLGINGILEKVLELKANHFRASGIEVEKNFDPDLPMTLLDFHQMQQVLLNLFNNSGQALSEKGKGGRIRVSTRRVNDQIEIRMTDNGPGVPTEIQDKIFEPFFTTKKKGKGTGLGLSLCYGIIQEHGGNIEIESEGGNGATFVITLPILIPKPEMKSEEEITGAEDSSRMRILVVDDDEAILGFFVEYLNLRGHRVDTASDSSNALEKIARNGHDMVITDINLQHGSGKDVFRAVVETNPNLARRILFTTGDGSSQELENMVKERGNRILFKPFTIAEIDRAIQQTLQN